MPPLSGNEKRLSGLKGRFPADGLLEGREEGVVNSFHVDARSVRHETSLRVGVELGRVLSWGKWGISIEI